MTSMKNYASSPVMRRGYSLVELLVALAVIGVLSAVAILSFNAVQVKKFDTKRAADMREIETALAEYYDTNGRYPIQVANSAWGAWGSECTNGGGMTANNVIPGLAPTYIPSMPSDPQMDKANNKCCYVYRTDAAGGDYKFLVLDCPTSKMCYGSVRTGYIDPVRPGYYAGSYACMVTSDASRTSTNCPGTTCW